MSRKWCCLVLGVFFVLCAAGGITPEARAATTLTFSDFFPPTHAQSQLCQAWCKEVEKRTGGEVKVEFYPGQTLTKSTQNYDGVVQGLSDIGQCLFGYTRGRFPLMEAVDLPVGYTSGKNATKVANAFVEKFQPKELADVKVMYVHAHGPGLLHTKKKPVHNTDDLKGLKIRSHGTTAKVVEALGGVPVAMPMPELYQSLQKGVVDGALYPLETNKGWKMAEVVDCVTLSFSMAYTSTFYVVMNKGKWDGLSDKAKAAIEEINKEWQPKHGEAWDKIDADGLALMKEKKRQIIEMDPAEAAKWAKLVEPVIAEYVAATKAKGLPADEAVAFIREMLTKLEK